MSIYRLLDNNTLYDTNCIVFSNEDPVFVYGDSYYVIETLSLKKMKLDRGYIINNLVYIYRGNFKSNLTKDDYGIYKEGSKFVYIPIEKAVDKKKFSADNIVSISLSSLWEEIKENKNNFITQEDVDIINNNNKDYRPIISADDDPLKVLVKKSIIEKDINVNIYKGVFDKKHGLTNIKSTLTSKSKLTMLKFLQWCEILGLSYSISIADNGQNPQFVMDKILTYDSSKDEYTES